MTYKALTLDQIEVSPYNARTDKRPLSPKSIDAMARSLLSRGQIMPIVVHPMRGRKNVYGVFAGQRRYRAFKQLIEAGQLPRDQVIDAMTRDVESEAELIALSTAENLNRYDLYPYETYASVARSRRRNMSFEEIADILGQDVDWVRKSARIGMLPEKIFRAFAEDEISIEIARAFAATEDEKLQLHVFEMFNQHPKHERRADLVRRLMKVGDRELTRLLRYVGERAYQQAGGGFELDMFADDEEHRGIISDEGLLRQMATAKLDALRKQIRARADRPALRFAAEAPRNDFHQVDRALLITPPVIPLAPADEQQLQALRAEEASIVEIAGEMIGSDGRPFPGNETAVAALDERNAAVEAAIAELEAKRPIPLPAGDVVATIDIDDEGAIDLRFWWASQKAYAAAHPPTPRKAAPSPVAARPSPRPDPTPDQAAPPKPVADGAALTRGNVNDWTARERADRQLKEAFGLTAEGVQSMRTLRRSMLRTLMIQDQQDGGHVARDYLIWGQLRMLLTNAGSSAIGMRTFTGFGPVELREEKTGAELVEQATIGMFDQLLEEVKRWRCFTLPDLEIAFANYLKLEDPMKDQAAALLACMVLERSLEADGYRVGLHDMVAAEIAIGAADLREIGGFTPAPQLFNLFSKDHRLELAIPFVGRELVASWAKRPASEQNRVVSRIFTDQPADLLDQMGDQARGWIHPLLAFEYAAENEVARP